MSHFFCHCHSWPRHRPCALPLRLRLSRSPLLLPPTQRPFSSSAFPSCSHSHPPLLPAATTPSTRATLPSTRHRCLLGAVAARMPLHRRRPRHRGRAFPPHGSSVSSIPLRRTPLPSHPPLCLSSPPAQIIYVYRQGSAVMLAKCDDGERAARESRPQPSSSPGAELALADYPRQGIMILVFALHAQAKLQRMEQEW